MPTLTLELDDTEAMALAQLARSYISYDPETGAFTWIKSPARRVTAGDKCGSSRPDGYLYIAFKGKRWLAHRLAFCLMGKPIPTAIDHIDGNPANNCWRNLRPCNHSTNAQNGKLRPKNTSGTKGVSFFRQTKKWRVRVSVNKKEFGFGYYSNLELAELVAYEAREKYHGEFARHE